MATYRSFQELCAAERQAGGKPPLPDKPKPPPGCPAAPIDLRDLKRGWICLAHYHFSDGRPGKIRPILLISDTVGGAGGDVVCVPLSTKADQLYGNTLHLHPGVTGWSMTGLDRPSTIKCTSPVTLAAARVIGKLGELPEHLMQIVQRDLAALLGLPAVTLDNAA